MDVDIARLVADDRQHVWHPYAPMPAAVAPLPVTSAAGVRLHLADGRELVDGMSSWWAAVHGYAVPELDAAVADQERLYSASALLHTHCTHTARKLHASLTHAACTRA